MTTVNIHWDVLIPHHAWIKMGGSIDDRKRRVFKINQGPLPLGIRQGLFTTLHADVQYVNTIEHAQMSNLTTAVPLNTFITQRNIDMSK